MARTAPDFTIYKGEDAYIEVTVVDQDGAAKNVTSATISFRIGDSRANSVSIVKAGTIVNAVGGIIAVDLLGSETDDLDVRAYDYQFIVTDSDSDVQVVKAGKVDVKYALPAS